MPPDASARFGSTIVSSRATATTASANASRSVPGKAPSSSTMIYLGGSSAKRRFRARSCATISGVAASRSPRSTAATPAGSEAPTASSRSSAATARTACSISTPTTKAPRGWPPMRPATSCGAGTGTPSGRAALPGAGYSRLDNDAHSDHSTSRPIAAINLRYPGQYYDQETGWYVSSDPIGLAGGLNTYAYGMDNPLDFFDPLGLWGLIWIQALRLTEAIGTIAGGVLAAPADVPLLTAIGLVTVAYGAGEAIGEGINAVCRAPQ